MLLYILKIFTTYIVIGIHLQYPDLHLILHINDYLLTKPFGPSIEIMGKAVTIGSGLFLAIGGS